MALNLYDYGGKNTPLSGPFLQKPLAISYLALPPRSTSNDCLVAAATRLAFDVTLYGQIQCAF